MSFRSWWNNNIYDPFQTTLDNWFPGQGMPSDPIYPEMLNDVGYVNDYNKFYADEINEGKMSALVPNYPNFHNVNVTNNKLGSVLGGIGSLVGGIGGVASSIFNYIGQKNQLDYQKKLQQQIFQREDTSHQRAVEDLRKAGLSPTLAVGGSGAGSGAVVSTTAPQFNNPSVDFLAQISEKQKLDNMALQNKLLIAQIGQILANTRSTLTRSYGSELDNEYKQYRNDNYDVDFWWNKLSRFVR